MLIKTHELQTLFPIEYRISLLKDLKKAIVENKQLILDAFWEDMHKSPEQASLVELTGVLHELDYFIGNLKSLAKPQRIPKTLVTLNADMYTQAEPLGVTLLITPFNYPFNLSFTPLVGCLAAGNPVVLKYSKSNPKLKDAVKQILAIAKISTSIVRIYEFSNEELFKDKVYNLVIFTGSTATGRQIYENCSKTLTKCVLELGGFNPLVVDESADLQNAAEQILLGKFTNSGQTCISPNYCCFVGGQNAFDLFIQKLRLQLGKYVDNYQHLVKIDGERKYDELTELSRSGSLVTQVFEHEQLN